MVPVNRPESRLAAVSRRRMAVAILAAFGWAWAFGLIATHEHLLEHYFVFCSWPRLWGCIALPAGQLAIVCGSAVVWALACLQRANQEDCDFPRPQRWLALSYVIPLLDVLRIADMSLPLSFLEPLGFIALSGFVATDLARGSPINGRRTPPVHPLAWLGLVWLLTVAAGIWCYEQGLAAYDSYLLGYHDFGHFALRVASTWEGRGFLQETPSLPAFWDHFNPGLALLAPLWGLWPGAQLFILLQAMCLVLPAPLIFGIARAWGARASAAAAWSVSYLLMPSVSQLNLNYSYGWHPVSMALPLIFLAVWLLVKRQRIAALAAMLLACSFEETVVVAMACLCCALAFQAWWLRRQTTLAAWGPARGQTEGPAGQAALAKPVAHALPAARGRTKSPAGQADGGPTGTPLHDVDSQHAVAGAMVGGETDCVLARQLPPWCWLALAASLAAMFWVLFQTAGFAQFQTNRFANLGSSATEIALSPLLRPGEFWGKVLRPASIYFVLAITLPLGLQSVLRGWRLLLAAAPPVVVLLAWQRPAGACIAFQYVTTLIPVLLLAALAGASRCVETLGRQIPDAADPSERGLWLGGVASLATGIVAATFFGALPWSSPTQGALLAKSYGTKDGTNPRAVGTEANALLQEIVALVDDRDAAVLASGRIAAHLLRVRRLESVEQGHDRWQALAREAGEGRAAVEVFDWVVLDMREEFQQSRQKLQFCLDQAQRAGYETWRSGQGILLLARGGTGERRAAAP